MIRKFFVNPWLAYVAKCESRLEKKLLFDDNVLDSGESIDVSPSVHLYSHVSQSLYQTGEDLTKAIFWEFVEVQQVLINYRINRAKEEFLEIFSLGTYSDWKERKDKIKNRKSVGVPTYNENKIVGGGSYYVYNIKSDFVDSDSVNGDKRVDQNEEISNNKGVDNFVDKNDFIIKGGVREIGVNDNGFSLARLSYKEWVVFFRFLTRLFAFYLLFYVIGRRSIFPLLPVGSPFLQQVMLLPPSERPDYIGSS